MSSKRTNSQKQVFADHVKERMALFGPVDIRPMFGGFGIYRQGLMFALIADERLYFKTDDLSQPQFEARGFLQDVEVHGRPGRAPGLPFAWPQPPLTRTYDNPEKGVPL